jgi:hypothetical protein
MISAGGIVIRTPLEHIREYAGRMTSGVILMNLRDGDRLAAIAILEPTNGNGNGDDSSADVDMDADVEEDAVDEDALAALPSRSDIEASEAEAAAEDDASDDDDDEEEDVETDDAARDSTDR